MPRALFFVLLMRAGGNALPGAGVPKRPESVWVGDIAKRAHVLVPGRGGVGARVIALLRVRVPIRLIRWTICAGRAVPVRGLVVHLAACLARLVVHEAHGRFRGTIFNALSAVGVP